jgi:signal transduction histidine kinase
MRRWVLNPYLRLYDFIACKRIEKKDLPGRYIHAHLVAVLTTGILMWAYALVALFTIASPIPGIVGLIASVVHLLSPFLYRKNNNYFLNSNIFIAAGIVHQMTFAFFTGGFDSNILIWLGILPMLAGVIAGRKGALIWAIITTSCILWFFAMKLAGFHFPMLISPVGQVISQALILFGWIFISSIVIWVHVLLVEQNSAQLEESRGRIQNLINILSHDISTPLAVIAVKLRHLSKTDLTKNQQDMVAKANKASERVVEITESIRELRLTELGKKEISLAEIVVRDLILELKEIFTEKLDQKHIRLNWSVSSEVYSLKTNKSLLLNQVLGNLLSNAIKFSEIEGEIRLRVSREDEFVKFVLEDSGLGISKDMRENLFMAELSKSSVGTAGEMGTGFGLPIVKSCVDRLHGTISFETKTSQEGPAGTRFKILFPLL